MYLPVLLISYYGTSGWLAFAVPNVVGAAAMGWVLRTRQSASNLRVHHGVAVATFAAVTAAFHGFFFGFFFDRPGVPPWAPLALLAGLSGLVWMATARLRHADRVIAAAAWLGSAGVLAWLGWYRVNYDLPLPTFANGDAWQIWWLLPTFVLGFGLCPYLDPTFLRARESTTPGEAKAAFGLGFGVLFLSMIAATLLYADLLKLPLFVKGFGITLLMAHVAGQGSVTVGLHLREIGRASVGGAVAAVIAVVVAAFAGYAAARHDAGVAAGGAHLLGDLVSMPLSELGYLLFISFYGLVFPAYAWICLLPRRGKPMRSPAAAQWVACGLAIVAAAPLYWLGYIERGAATPWVAVGVGIILAARYLARAFERSQTT
jgi:hypothetical protein